MWRAKRTQEVRDCSNRSRNEPEEWPTAHTVRGSPAHRQDREDSHSHTIGNKTFMKLRSMHFLLQNFHFSLCALSTHAETGLSEPSETTTFFQVCELNAAACWRVSL